MSKSMRPLWPFAADPCLLSSGPPDQQAVEAIDEARSLIPVTCDPLDVPDIVEHATDAAERPSGPQAIDRKRYAALQANLGKSGWALGVMSGDRFFIAKGPVAMFLDDIEAVELFEAVERLHAGMTR